MGGGRTGIVTIGEQSVDHDGLREQASALAPRLAGAASVAVIAHPTLATVVTVLAALEAGVPVVPVSPDAGPRERDHVLSDAACALIMDDGELSTASPDGNPAIPAGTALVLYTSGTTGLPKGVPISHSAIETCLSGLADAWAWTSDDTLVHGLPLHHVHGLVLGVLGPLRIGGALHHTGRPTPEGYAAARGSLYFGVPTVWSRIAAHAASARSLAGARLLVSGSAALPAPTFDALSILTGHAPLERYGMTETLITLAARSDQPAVRGSVGGPLPGIEVRIVDDSGSLVEPHALGELQTAGPTVTAGYLHRADATAGSRTPDGWFRTGDVAVVDGEGRHRIVGRASTDLIKTGGYRVGAGEVEDALLAHPGVHEAAVIGQADEDLGQRIVAFVVADEHLDEQALIAFVADTLSVHKRPRAVHRLDSLPRNAMGKVDKGGLGA